MTETSIQVKNLRKVYRIGSEQVVALAGLSFEIPAGQVCCIVGTSGSGKSTLLNQLAGLEKPTKGQVLIGGRNISTLSENDLARFRQRNVGFVFQSYNLMPSMTALENVCMPLIFRGIGKARRERAARRILGEVGLAGRIRHTPSQMSGGQQQRVGIARAFVASPKIVFADEPTGNLDTATTTEVMEMMVRLVRQKQQTLIIVTHEPELALYADRVITIVDGHIVRDEENPDPIGRGGDTAQTGETGTPPPAGDLPPLGAPACEDGSQPIDDGLSADDTTRSLPEDAGAETQRRSENEE